MSVALVLGGAACVWDDAVDALRMFRPDLVVAVNDMIPLWPGPLDAAGSLHPDNLPRWLEARRAAGLPAPGEVWSYRAAPRVTRVTEDWRGSSGLLMLKVALFERRCDGAILAGVPMDRSANVARPGAWGDAHAFYPGWFAHRKDIEKRMCSMSGWTRHIFGAPTAEWLVRMKASPADEGLISAIERQKGGHN